MGDSGLQKVTGSCVDYVRVVWKPGCSTQRECLPPLAVFPKKGAKSHPHGSRRLSLSATCPPFCPAPSEPCSSSRVVLCAKAYQALLPKVTPANSSKDSLLVSSGLFPCPAPCQQDHQSLDLPKHELFPSFSLKLYSYNLLIIMCLLPSVSPSSVLCICKHMHAERDSSGYPPSNNPCKKPIMAILCTGCCKLPVNTMQLQISSK